MCQLSIWNKMYIYQTLETFTQNYLDKFKPPTTRCMFLVGQRGWMKRQRGNVSSLPLNTGRQAKLSFPSLAKKGGEKAVLKYRHEEEWRWKNNKTANTTTLFSLPIHHGLGWENSLQAPCIEAGGGWSVKEENLMPATTIQSSQSVAFQRGPLTAYVKQILTQIV